MLSRIALQECIQHKSQQPPRDDHAHDLTRFFDKIPHSKQGRQLYFSRKELTDWLKSGKRKTQAELALDAENFSPINSKNKTTVAARRQMRRE